mmetsp:Transcript_11106/g.24469  ORF Transcript_11106/g.24469 Transcript_11106/m.24469 type:complete len:95 (-) Transcript_11106:472-756(-)
MFTSTSFQSSVLLLECSSILKRPLEGHYLTCITSSIESLGYRKSYPSWQDYFPFFHLEDFQRHPKTEVSHQLQRTLHSHHLDFDPCEEPLQYGP